MVDRVQLASTHSCTASKNEPWYLSKGVSRCRAWNKPIGKILEDKMRWFNRLRERKQTLSCWERVLSLHKRTANNGRILTSFWKEPPAENSSPVQKRLFFVQSQPRKPPLTPNLRVGQVHTFLWCYYSQCREAEWVEINVSHIWKLTRVSRSRITPSTSTGCASFLPATTSACTLPVCVGSDLGDLRLAPRQDLVQIGRIEEEELHVDGRGRGFPGLEHTAALDQHDLLLRHKTHSLDQFGQTWYFTQTVDSLDTSNISQMSFYYIVTKINLI